MLRQPSNPCPTPTTASGRGVPATHHTHHCHRSLVCGVVLLDCTLYHRTWLTAQNSGTHHVKKTSAAGLLFKGLDRALLSLVFFLDGVLLLLLVPVSSGQQVQFLSFFFLLRRFLKRPEFCGARGCWRSIPCSRAPERGPSPPSSLSLSVSVSDSLSVSLSSNLFFL